MSLLLALTHPFLDLLCPTPVHDSQPRHCFLLGLWPYLNTSKIYGLVNSWHCLFTEKNLIAVPINDSKVQVYLSAILISCYSINLKSACANWAVDNLVQRLHLFVYKMASDFAGFRTLLVNFNESCQSCHVLYYRKHTVRREEINTPSDKTIFAVNIPPYCTKVIYFILIQYNYFMNRNYWSRTASANLYFR